MRPVSVCIATLGVTAATAAGALGAGPPPAGKVPASRVTLAECHPSDDVTQRFASFNGQMHAVPGAKRMAMRFTLLERIGNDVTGYKPVALPDLKPWRRSRLGVRTFIYTQRVTALRDDGYYRMRVQFRWYGTGGKVLKTSFGRSHTCRQPAPLPNLQITSITSAAGPTQDKRTYSITVANIGAGDADNFGVGLKVDGTDVATAQVAVLPAQETTVLQLTGPPCSVGVRAVADPDRVVRETDENDNVLAMPCAQLGRS